MNPAVARLAHGEISGPIVVGRVRGPVARKYHADATQVWLSFDTLRKQLIRHPDITLDLYEDLEWLLRDGEFVPDYRENCFHIFSIGEEPSHNRIKATLKVVRKNNRIMLLSLHKVRHSDYRRLVKRSAKK